MITKQYIGCFPLAQEKSHHVVVGRENADGHSLVFFFFFGLESVQCCWRSSPWIQHCCLVVVVVVDKYCCPVAMCVLCMAIYSQQPMRVVEKWQQ